MRFSEALMKIFGNEVRVRKNTIFSKYLKETNLNPLYYLIDWKYRTRVNLKWWIGKQVDDNGIADQIIVEQGWNDIDDDDELIVEILKWVKNNFVYATDQIMWSTPEHWNTFEESVEKEKMDCEDGAVMIMVLARKCGISEDKIKIVAGYVWDGQGTNPKYLNTMTTAFKKGDKKCQKENKDFKKEINYGTIQMQLQQELKKEKEKVLKQNLKKEVFLQTKEIVQKMREGNLFGNLLKIGKQFVIDVVKRIELNLQYIILTKIDLTILQKIWKFFARVVTQNTTGKHIHGTKIVNGMGGHAFVLYTDKYGGDVPIDWCYWYSGIAARNRKEIWKNYNYNYGEQIWFAFNDKQIFVKR